MAGEFGPNVLAGINVLVVEDHDDTREMFRVLFEMNGATVAEAGTGEGGWHAFQRQRPDVVLSDLSMPNGTGHELVQRIRLLPAEQGGLTPAIAMSAAGGRVEESFAAGFHAHLSKPTDPLGLIEVVRGFVREGAEARPTWTLTTAPKVACLTFTGHPTADAMRAATRALAKLLAAGPHHVVVDLRTITGFDPAVGSVAERTVWHVRRNIAGATIVGGSFLARLVARTACVALGVACAFTDVWRDPTVPPA